MAPSVRATAFRNGEAVPELKPDILRLYSMRFCPYAQRTRLVLAHKNIEHETININLKDKPDWFLAKNPLGLVPVVERNDTIVYESGICDDYLEEVFPERPLYPKDPYQKARLRILMERFGKASSAFLQMFRAAGDEAKITEALKDLTTALKPFEDALQGKFFGGDDLSMVDVHIWPWIERGITNKSNDILKDSPKLAAWSTNMLSHPTVQATLFSGEMHKKFHESYITGTPNYDLGL